MTRTFATTMMLLAAAATMASGGTDYGKGVTVQEATPIAELVADPGAFVGKTVRVDGTVTGVCKMRGCWIQVTDAETGDGVRVKVEDGVIVFPPEVMGHRGSAQGVWEVVAGAAEHAGGATKEHVCPEGETHAAPPAAVYQLRGTGAVVY